MRLDKWLWVARFFKTRALAQAAIEGGKVKVDGERVKQSKAVAASSRIEIGTGDCVRVVVVSRLAERRGSARDAIQLYEETEESRSRREQAAVERGLSVEPARALRGRPTKKDRRALDRLRRGEN
jgi:ribosome-associated heat shock protein Hsp15